MSHLDVFFRNPTDIDMVANRMSAFICTILVLFILGYFVMLYTHVITTDDHASMYVGLLVSTALLFLGLLVNRVSAPDSWWIRYALMVPIIVTSLVVSVAMKNNYLIFALPIVLCSLYESKVFAAIISIVCGILILLEPFVAFGLGIINQNFVSIAGWNDTFIMIADYGADSIIHTLQEHTVPSFLLFMTVAVLAIWIADLRRKHTMRLNDVTVREATMERDVSIATDIQMGMLPEDISDEKGYSVMAEMHPARTVGGDFYDFFKVDDSHIAIVIADVSGKGIPAALFMASAKSSLRSNLANGFPPEMVMKMTNQVLCDTNREKMFVTAWLGVIDLDTGRISYVNAGHNPPFILRNGELVKLEDKPNFILGRKKSVGYDEHRTDLLPGDRLVLYTDGVTEAVGADGMFGEERFREAILSSDGTPKGILRSVKDGIDGFVEDMDRSDDITILVFGMEEYEVDDNKGAEFLIKQDTFDAIMKYIRGELEAQGCPENVIRDMEICSSEILANIDGYAYLGQGGDLEVAVKVKDRTARITFRDSGPEYNPLLKENPDLEKRIRDHKIGGFGLFIVRKKMDDCIYARRENKNVLTIKKGY